MFRIFVNRKMKEMFVNEMKSKEKKNWRILLFFVAFVLLGKKKKKKKKEKGGSFFALPTLVRHFPLFTLPFFWTISCKTNKKTLPCCFPFSR
jgi:hypothetical protein